MSQNLTICTYHTILSNKDTKFPEFKDKHKDFTGQLDFYGTIILLI